MSCHSVQGRIWAAVTWVVLTATAVCYTNQDLMSARCDVACAREGYGAGIYDPRSTRCVCQDAFPVERIMRKKITLPRRVQPNTSRTSSEALSSPSILLPNLPWNE